MSDCEAQGCKRGGCIKLVRDGAIATRYGVTAPTIESTERGR
jgi:hypothetical protein